MERLFDEGHRHISFLGVPHADVTTGKRRHEAYLDACERLKLTPRATLGELSYQSGFQHAAEVIDAAHHRAGVRHGYAWRWGRANICRSSRRIDNHAGVRASATRR